MRDDHIKLIREKCIAANPKIQERDGHKCRHHDGLIQNFSEPCTCGPIRLADVLLAIDSAGLSTVVQLDTDGEFSTWDSPNEGGGQFKRSLVSWNLRKDDLTEQSDETIAFLADLLK